MKDSSRKRMQLYVEKTEKLTNFSYYKHIQQQGGTKIEFGWKRDEGDTWEDNLPRGEIVDAVVGTLRMFIQKGDQVSLPKMAELYDDPDISEGWKAHHRRIRGWINEYLDQSTPIRIGGKTPTVREVFAVFVHGEYAHTEQKEIETLELWRSLGHPFYGMLEHEFHTSIVILINYANSIAMLCEEELSGRHIPPPE